MDTLTLSSPLFPSKEDSLLSGMAPALSFIVWNINTERIGKLKRQRLIEIPIIKF